jgi:hypothetical protein
MIQRSEIRLRKDEEEAAVCKDMVREILEKMLAGREIKKFFEISPEDPGFKEANFIVVRKSGERISFLVKGSNPAAKWHSRTPKSLGVPILIARVNDPGTTGKELRRLISRSFQSC